MATLNTGQKGEALAAAHLLSRGYTILEMNWRCTRGEIDIIARDGKATVFVEVRTRHAEHTAEAFESINQRKQSRLQAAVYTYVDEHQLENTDWRIDVIAVALTHEGKALIEQVEDALDW